MNVSFPLSYFKLMCIFVWLKLNITGILLILDEWAIIDLSSNQASYWRAQWPVVERCPFMLCHVEDQPARLYSMEQPFITGFCQLVTGKGSEQVTSEDNREDSVSRIFALKGPLQLCGSCWPLLFSLFGQWEHRANIFDYVWFCSHHKTWQPSIIDC